MADITSARLDRDCAIPTKLAHIWLSSRSGSIGHRHLHILCNISPARSQVLICDDTDSTGAGVYQHGACALCIDRVRQLVATHPEQVSGQAKGGGGILIRQQGRSSFCFRTRHGIRQQMRALPEHVQGRTRYSSLVGVGARYFIGVVVK